MEENCFVRDPSAPATKPPTLAELLITNPKETLASFGIIKTKSEVSDHLSPLTTNSKSEMPKDKLNIDVVQLNKETVSTKEKQSKSRKSGKASLKQQLLEQPKPLYHPTMQTYSGLKEKFKSTNKSPTAESPTVQVEVQTEVAADGNLSLVLPSNPKEPTLNCPDTPEPPKRLSAAELAEIERERHEMAYKWADEVFSSWYGQP